jgi:periplasmic protein TonB
MGETRVPEEGNALLHDCFVDSDTAEARRERRTKRRALIASIILQALIVTVLVLFPLFGKGENIASTIYVPVPPYSLGKPHTAGKPAPRQQHAPPRSWQVFQPTFIAQTIATHDDRRDVADNQTSADGDYIPGAPEGQAIPGALPIVNSHAETPPPPEQPKRIRVSQSVIEARLVRKVQPAYPILAIQVRREGRVELHAIIAKNGSIESLEVVSGDPMFLQSALAAVRDWRYQPTLLNGQPVEVDTTIVVIYTLSH